MVVQQTPVISGYGLAAFYWAASEAGTDLPWESSSAQVRLAVNPLIDPSPASHTLALTWNDTGDTDETADELADDIKAILASIETNDPEVDQGEYVSPTGVTLAGQSIVAAAFSQLVTLAASAFDFARIAVGEDISYDEVEIGGLAVPQITETFEGVLPPAEIILRPDGAGYTTNLSIVHWGLVDCSANWECVDDTDPDRGDSAVWTRYLTNPPLTDAYALQDLTDLPPNASVDSVTVTFRERFTWSSDGISSDQGLITLGLYLNGASTLGTTETVTLGGPWLSITQQVGRPGGGTWQQADFDDLQVTATLDGWPLYITQIYVTVHMAASQDVTVKLRARHYADNTSGIVVSHTSPESGQSATDITGSCTLGDDRQTLTCTGVTPYEGQGPSNLVVTYHSATEGEDGPFMTSVAGFFGAFGIPWAAGRVVFVGVVIAVLIGFNVSLFRGSTEFLVIAWTGDVLFYAARAGALPWAPVLLILFLVVIAGALGTFKRVTL